MNRAQNLGPRVKSFRKAESSILVKALVIEPVGTIDIEYVANRIIVLRGSYRHQ